MKLFLASLASATLDLAIPLLPDKPQNLRLAFIPTAADPYGEIPMPWMEADHKKLSDMGFIVTDYDIKNKNLETLRKDLSQFQVIFVAGGNVYYLLDVIKKTGFDIVIKELLTSGTLYIGASAGSVVMCPTIEHVRTIEHPEGAPDLIDFTGLNLTDKLIAPHYGNPKYIDRYKQIIAQWGEKLVPLRDDQAVIVNDGETKIVTK